MNQYWKNDTNFKKLCDMVAQDHLICFTGAGISKPLKTKEGKNAPDWLGLLNNIYSSLENIMSNEERKDIEDLLSENASGEQLIEASSILYKKDERLFLQALQKSVDLEEGATSQTHKAILTLRPRGILTYNYDNAHENAMNQMSEDAKKSYTPKIILPSDNTKIIDLLRTNFKHPFLFKAHGTVNDIKTLVLTSESYRDLFNKYPYYKVFMQYIFTNFQLLIIGFGLSDPDFDSLLQNVFSIFGSPIQEHLVIKHKEEKSPKDTLYRLRYGLHFLYVESFDDIPQILEASTLCAGKMLTRVIHNCLSSDLKTRSQAHNDIKNLSNIGKTCLANILERKIKHYLKEEKCSEYANNTKNSELVYSYGIIANSIKSATYTQFLIYVVNTSQYSEPIAHALVHLRDLLKKDDMAMVQKWMIRFKKKRFKIDNTNPDPDNRVYKYCEAIYYLIEAKYSINSMPSSSGLRNP